jgi:hypothetical protein
MNSKSIAATALTTWVVGFTAANRGQGPAVSRPNPQFPEPGGTRHPHLPEVH